MRAEAFVVTLATLAAASASAQVSAPAGPGPISAWPAAGAAEIAREQALTGAVTSPVRSPGEGVDAGPPPAEVVRAFDDACIGFEGQLQPVVDWAITQGFEPLDPLAPDVQPLLDGRTGSALAAPGRGVRLVLAVAEGRHCVVWAERVSGPALRLALLQRLADRSSRGDRLTEEVDRKVERAGAWRQQTEWRYRRTGGASDYGIGAVTSIGDAPSAQVLRFAPSAAPAPLPSHAPSPR